MRPIPPLAVDFVAREETFRAEAYRDSGGVWTNGFGNTNGVTEHTPPVSLADAKLQLGHNMGTAQVRLSHCLGAAQIDGLSACEYSALLSFAYNAGADPSWEIWSAVQHGATAVAAQLLRFVHAGDQVVQGLVNRRHAEISLYEGRDPLCATEGKSS